MSCWPASRAAGGAGGRVAPSSFSDFITQHNCQMDLAANSARRQSRVPSRGTENVRTNYSSQWEAASIFYFSNVNPLITGNRPMAERERGENRRDLVGTLVQIQFTSH